MCEDGPEVAFGDLANLRVGFFSVPDGPKLELYLGRASSRASVLFSDGVSCLEMAISAAATVATDMDPGACAPKWPLHIGAAPAKGTAILPKRVVALALTLLSQFAPFNHAFFFLVRGVDLKRQLHGTMDERASLIDMAAYLRRLDIMLPASATFLFGANTDVALQFCPHDGDNEVCFRILADRRRGVHAHCAHFACVTGKGHWPARRIGPLCFTSTLVHAVVALRS